MYMMSLFFLKSQKEDSIFHSYQFSKFFISLRLMGFYSEWGVFTKLRYGVGSDLKIFAKTAKAKYVWYMIRDKKIGDFIIYNSSSRSIIAQLYSKIGKYFLNHFYKNHLQRYFKEKNDELLELKIEAVTLDVSAEDYEVVKNRTIKHKRISGYSPELQFSPQGNYFEWKK